jgi:hypothetical protein
MAHDEPDACKLMGVERRRDAVQPWIGRIAQMSAFWGMQYASISSRQDVTRTELKVSY